MEALRTYTPDVITSDEEDGGGNNRETERDKGTYCSWGIGTDVFHI